MGITAGSGGTVLVAGGTYESVLTSDHSTSAGNYSKGYSVGNTVLSGGTEIVGSDGYATSSVITSGGVELISDGGSAIQTTVQSGGEVYVSSGGVALQTVNSGYVDVQSGGYLGSGTNVDNGKIVIENGGSGGGLQINGGELVMQNGAIGSDITVNSGGLGSILSGAFVDKLTVSGGEAVMNSGATAGAIAVTGDPNNQGHLSFLGGAVIQNGVVSAGRAGVVDIGSGASVFSAAAYGDDTTNAVPNAAGTIILSSAAIEHVSVQKGGVISAGADSYINDLFISGGTAYLFSGAQIQGNQAFVRGDYTTVINDPKYHHGDLHIMSGAGLDDVVASAGGRLYVHGGAHINNAVATRRGEVIVESGGSIDTATITTNRNVGGAMLVPGSMFVDNGGEVGSALVSGGQVEIASGGHVGSATIAFASGSGGAVTIDESGTLDSALVASGGTATVISGGTLTSATVTTAGSAVVGGVVDQLVISGGYGTVQAGATVGDVQILAGGSGLFLSGASAISITVASGGWVGGPTVTDGHSLTVYSGGTSVGAVITSKDDASRTASGGSMTSTTIVGAVQSGSLGGILTIESGAVMTQTSMGYNARLRILGFKYDSEGTTFVQNGKLVVTENGQTWTLDLMGNYPDSEGQSSPDNGFQLLDDGYGNTIIIYDKCFLPGTLLRLEKGETAVENVKKGDRIFVYENGQKSVREVTSVLKRHSVVNKNMPDELAGWAVQVCKDAFAPGVPSQDLFVTPEHCFYLEGRFVPARMLVNGASIRYDYSQESYDYYHVETELHSVIWANNTLTESYLNTGERRSIKSENEDMGRIVRLRELTWHNDAAAPLEVSRDFVEPLYNNFRERAVSLGYKEADLQAQKQNYTEDSQLRLILDNGTVIEKSRESNGRAIFYLPANARGVRLVSNSFRPSATIGPFIDDRRDLGVLVGKVELWVGGREIDVTAHLERDNLPGWSVVEAGPHRWTMGDAFLPLPECYVPEGERMLLSIQLEAGGPYPISSVSDSPALSA
ncbi:hypothetical protein GT348_07895 [Aristophania vespae]|uniref:Hedgehog/Intein (Hint) domain-containing protein n=1 Tax=Aristophania vespae TaxID=2697033 RepID=A0A6P1NF30_9PROT|nr:Hint domain-containing protein [Aristophania vespae]QHI96159.1 hypothetical protein GT348_07895 [Aristophania vespae]